MQIGHLSSSQAPQLPVPAIQDLIVATSLPQGFPTISHSSPQDRKHWGTWVLSAGKAICLYYWIGGGIMEKLALLPMRKGLENHDCLTVCCARDNNSMNEIVASPCLDY